MKPIQTPLLEVKDLEVVFNTKDGVVRAVNGISYTLAESEILGIVGESGCGKSVSCLSMLRLLPEPPAKILKGEVLFQGENLLKGDRGALYGIRGRQIAMVFQDPMTSLNPVLTIGYQIEEAILVNLGVSRREARARTIEVLSQVGIPRAQERLNDYPHQFSGGMRQRVMIAMGISCMPKLLIADEPTTALDVTIQAQIVELVKKLQQELHMAVIWITHDLGVIARLAKHINVMYGGKIVESGPIHSIFKTPHHPYTAGLLNSIPRAMTGRGQKLQYIEGSPPDLIRLPAGCSFAPRCHFATQRCAEERPELLQVGERHQAACWNIDALRQAQSTGPA
jgi:oligopeptide transport system ATP-binding protein